jgi:hypothetical protein
MKTGAEIVQAVEDHRESRLGIVPVDPIGLRTVA